ncbi:DUF6735 family protein [Halobacterium wangiae]|uniref:DUF6735 family protein n=1 Tax=Halobacterium wangiae TaxID=2902623 RepID=UPI001E57EAB7|nr:DUF6735 family protein [Halobacterium wangiae]
MGHRALIAYERPDELYNLHYTHWGGLKLRLKTTLSPQTSYGETEPITGNRQVFGRFLEESNPESVPLEETDSQYTDVDITPLDTRVTLEVILSEHLDYEVHEALYVVNLDFEVEAYRTFALGFGDFATSVDSSSRRGHGVVSTVRWYDGEPVGDAYIRGWFAGARELTGVMIDRDVFTERQATTFLVQRLLSKLRDQTTHVRRADQPTHA